MHHVFFTIFDQTNHVNLHTISKNMEFKSFIGVCLLEYDILWT